MAQTTVVNMKDPTFTYDVFIGRPSKWGNPYKIGLDGDRAAVIAKYREWLRQHPTLDPRELRGKVLACYCAPLPCHGDVLAAFADCEHPNTHTVRTGESEWILDCDDCGYKMARITASSSPALSGPFLHAGT